MKPTRHSNIAVRSPLQYLPIFVLLSLVYFASRLHALNIMPLHFDEAVHLTRAIEVWHGHPFWDISDGRIINQWAIAAFYPQNAPVFAARFATILVSLPGLAAGYALVRRWFGQSAGFLAAVLWITCPYLFFYERTALIDGEVGALAVVAVWASLHLTQTGRNRDALIAGLALAIALLFKFTALPFALSVGLIVLFIGKTPWRKRILHLLLIGAVVAACFAVPVLYAALHQGFGTAAGWLAGGGGTLTLDSNLQTFGAQLTDYGTVIWSVLLIIGLIGILAACVVPSLLADRPRRDLIVLLVAAILPLITILLITRFVMPRHLAVCMAILVILAGGGLGLLVQTIVRLSANTTWLAPALTGAAAILLAVGIIPFAAAAYTNPGTLPLPSIERQQYQTGYSSGFGLREAVLDFPNTVGKVGTLILSSMYPDGCRLANFYDTWGYKMRCSDLLTLDGLKAQIKDQQEVFVLVEALPGGLHLKDAPGVQAEQIAAYPRPGESAESASVSLWRVQLTK